MNALEEYKQLLRTYHELISQTDWHDGRREKLIEQMSKVWNRMSKKDHEAVQGYMHELYQKRIA